MNKCDFLMQACKVLKTERVSDKGINEWVWELQELRKVEGVDRHIKQWHLKNNYLRIK